MERNAMLHDAHPRLAQAAGPLVRYLDDPTVIEVRVTSAGAVFLVRFGLGKERVEDCTAKTLDTFLALIADMVGAEWRESSPRLHAANPRLGLRIQAGRPPMSDAPWMVCRKHPQQVFPLDDFEAKAILTHHAGQRSQRRPVARSTIRATLETALHDRYTILVSGAVGSAKTSLLNALLHDLASSTERIVILEDDPELRCDAQEVQTVHTSDQPLITMRDLGKDLLRMSPDRIVVGEVRDGTALDMLKAFQTGHPGLCTVHASSAMETLTRLEQLVQEVSVDPQRHLIGEAVDVIVHMEQFARSWRVTDMLAVDGWDGHQYKTRSLL
jgi:type IV secretion system protein VirB11